ncbi:MAG TPA: R3H domain-containing nucleic acid-binding protein [Thermoanaerobaculia bacterium]|nr:R3H domain-containing nucleic acid-binding protein [Thermoanaerobaculia bacterium]
MAQRYEGKNIDEALSSAAEALGVERYRLLYHVVLEKRGFLGGMKRVVIEAEVNDQAPETAVAQAEAQPPASGPPRRERGGQGRERRGGGGRGREGRRDTGREEPRRGRSRRDRGERGDRGGETMPPPVAEEAPPQEAESEAASAVRKWCEEVLQLGGFEVELRTSENDAQIVVKLYGRDTSRMLDRHGELLDALQVLANKALVGRRIEKDIELDCGAFKERRVEELGERARATAERVRRDGREQLLPAMSPIERRIVHLALQDDEQVMTESRGDGFYKRVAIKLRPQDQHTTEP